MMRAPSRGAVVIYASGRWNDGRDRFRIARVVGPVAVDPTTGGTWIGVRLPTTNALDLVAGNSIVNISPP